MLPQDHPVWRIINLAVLLAGVTLILWVNAGAFDETEVKAIIELILAMGGYEAFKHFGAIPSANKSKDSSD